MEKLIKIQSELKAPKNQYNNFGKYKYRNAEDILESVKPLLKKYDCMLTISDKIIEVGTRVYIKSVCKFSDGEKTIEVSASAREAETKKGMDESQITGTASSYARKCALNGLFLIDDTKDSDYTNNSEKKPSNKKTKLTNEKYGIAVKSNDISALEKSLTAYELTEAQKKSIQARILQLKKQQNEK